MSDQDEDLQGAFGDKGLKLNDISYDHPKSEALLEGIKEILIQSYTGHILWNVSVVHKIPIKILKGNGEPQYLESQKIVYIQVPTSIDEVTPKQILDLCRALRSAEQCVLGLTTPDPTEDMINYASVMHAKNLDAIVHMCKVVHELEDNPIFPNIFDTLTKLGYRMIYDAHVSEASKDEVFDAYAKS